MPRRLSPSAAADGWVRVSFEVLPLLASVCAPSSHAMVGCGDNFDGWAGSCSAVVADKDCNHIFLPSPPVSPPPPPRGNTRPSLNHSPAPPLPPPIPSHHECLSQKPAASEPIELDLEAGLLFPGRAFVDDSMAQKGGDGDEGESREQSRARVEFRLERVGDGGGGGGGGGGCALGPMVTVTRERQYRRSFDDGLLYKGESRGAVGREDVSFFPFCLGGRRARATGRGRGTAWARSCGRCRNCHFLAARFSLSSPKQDHY